MGIYQGCISCISRTWISCSHKSTESTAGRCFIDNIYQLSFSYKWGDFSLLPRLPGIHHWAMIQSLYIYIYISLPISNFSLNIQEASWVTRFTRIPKINSYINLFQQEWQETRNNQPCSLADGLGICAPEAAISPRKITSLDGPHGSSFQAFGRKKSSREMCVSAKKMQWSPNEAYHVQWLRGEFSFVPRRSNQIWASPLKKWGYSW